MVAPKFNAEFEENRRANAATSYKRRTSLCEALGKDAHYLLLAKDSKAPVGKYSQGGKNRLTRPTDDNFGVIPQRRLIILDIDNHNQDASSVNEQVDFFSRFFEVDFRNTLTVKTPSGGMHIYLRLPAPITKANAHLFPKATLRGYSEEFSEIANEYIKLDADIRSAATLGYVVGPWNEIAITEDVDPDSRSSGIVTHIGKYIPTVGEHSIGSSKDDQRSIGIAEIPAAGVAKLKKVVQLSKDNKSAVVVKRSVNRQKFDTALDTDVVKGKPGDAVVANLVKSLAGMGLKSFHAKRAFVKAALHCCHSDLAIAAVCVDLKINRDTYTDDEISLKCLVRDLEAFQPHDKYHGIYCLKGRRKRSKSVTDESLDNGKSLEDNMELLRNRMRAGKIARYAGDQRRIDPRVIDPALVSSALMGDSKKPSQQYRDAMAIFDYFIQPLSNAGARRILLAKRAVASNLNLTDSRVTQAMRILRDRGILIIKQRQRTGMAPTYAVSHDFTHVELTTALRMVWKGSESVEMIEHAPIYFNREACAFVSVFSGEELPFDRNISVASRAVKDGTLSAPVDFVGPGAAVAYLREQSEALGLKVVDSGMIIVVDTGEIVDNSFKPIPAHLKGDSGKKEIKAAADRRLTDSLYRTFGYEIDNGVPYKTVINPDTHTAKKMRVLQTGSLSPFGKGLVLAKGSPMISYNLITDEAHFSHTYSHGGEVLVDW